MVNVVINKRLIVRAALRLEGWLSTGSSEQDGRYESPLRHRTYSQCARLSFKIL